MRKIDYIVLHCTAGPQTQTVEAIQAYWKKMGWRSPGYHFLYLEDGTEKQLCDIAYPTNGVAGKNANSIHLSYTGGVAGAGDPLNSKGTPIDNRTDGQKDAMQKRIILLNEMFPVAVITGHRDFSPDKNRNGIIEPHEWIKACPSFSVKNWLDEIGFKSKALQPTLTTTTRVHLRDGEGTEFKSLGLLEKGTEVVKLAEGSLWVYVSFQGTKGWVSAKYLK